MNTSATQEQDFLLSRESALAAMSIGQGLSLIRKYDFVKHGYGTQAFFMLSIGIERLLKVIIIYNYRRKNNNAFPDNQVLKNNGHNIRKLFDQAIHIADEISKQELYQSLKADPIFDMIINFLTEFANSSRYYNLDTLSGKLSHTDEPLRKWNKTINRLIVERHFKQNENKAQRISALANMIEDRFIVSFENENGKKITNIRDFYLEGMTVDVKQKYSMFYSYVIVRFLSNLLWNLDRNYHPFVSEYFMIFRNTDDSYVRSRKTWNLYDI